MSDKEVMKANGWINRNVVGLAINEILVGFRP